MSKENDNKVEYLMYFIRALYLGASISILLTNQGTLQSIIISRNICLGVIIIATICVIALQIDISTTKIHAASYVGLYSIIIALCISYIYYINKSYLISENTDIVTNVYSNSFIYMMVMLSLYLGYNAGVNIEEFVYCTTLLFSCVMICLIYPLIITLVYYKTDGFENINSIYF
jgi:uncharacterized membrane protein YoaK (UPF0700 family)